MQIGFSGISYIVSTSAVPVIDKDACLYSHVVKGVSLSVIHQRHCLGFYSQSIKVLPPDGTNFEIGRHAFKIILSL